MGKITIEVKINTFGTMLYSLNHPNYTCNKLITFADGKVKLVFFCNT